MKSPQCFEGMRVLVTGASGGIGGAVAEELLRRGARVGMHYWRNEPDPRKFRRSSRTKENMCLLKADLRNTDAMDSMFKKFIRWAGGIDALVNNAGDVSKRTDFLDVTASEIGSDLSLNLVAPFWLSRLAIAHMKKSGVKGSIVNVSSIAAKFGGSRQTLFYGLAKAALETMTFSLGRHCAPLGIRVNCVRLGVFDTPFHQRHVKDMTERIRLIPAGRMGNPDEAAWWIVSLLDSASRYMNGQVVSLTGGE